MRLEIDSQNVRELQAFIEAIKSRQDAVEAGKNKERRVRVMIDKYSLNNSDAKYQGINTASLYSMVDLFRIKEVKDEALLKIIVAHQQENPILNRIQSIVVHPT